MGIILWIVFGALAGWIASIIMGDNAKMGALANIALGLIGSVLGGFIASLLGLGSVSGFNLYSLLIAIGGAVIVLLIARGFSTSKAE